MKCFFISMWALLVFSFPLSAQYLGGDGDGSDQSDATQVSLFGVPQGLKPLYSGGYGHGFAKSQVAVSLNNFDGNVMYDGGRGNGFVKVLAGGALSGMSMNAMYDGGWGNGFVKVQVAGSPGEVMGDALYGGGSGNGFDKELLSSFLSGAVATLFFDGGEGNGFSKVETASTLGGGSLGMYGGGEGDGFATLLSGGTLSGFLASGMFTGGKGDGFATTQYDGTLNPFPIALLTFDAIPQETFVLVQWVTEQETHNDFFTVERTLEGDFFEEVSFLPSQGDSETIQSYEITDPHPLPGQSFYRLKWTDLDGISGYSEMVEVFFKTQNDFSMVIFPNPNKGDEMGITLSGLSKQDHLDLEVFDMAGKKVLERNGLQSGTTPHAFSIDLRGQLPMGSYVVRMIKNGHQQASKILIIKE